MKQFPASWCLITLHAITACTNNNKYTAVTAVILTKQNMSDVALSPGNVGENGIDEYIDTLQTASLSMTFTWHCKCIGGRTFNQKSMI